MNNEPLPPTPEEIHKWDSVRFTLRQFAAEHKIEACRVGKKLAERIQAEIDRVNNKKKKGIEEDLALLSIAREFLLDRESMEAPSDFIVDPNNPPPGFLTIGVDINETIPVWMEQAYKAVGRFDIAVNRTFMNFVGHLENAVNGGIDDFSNEKKIDLENTSALDAYIHALSAHWSQGKYSPDVFRSDLDPNKAVVNTATVYWGLAHIMLEFLRDDQAKIRPTEDWWMIAVAVLVCSDPDFDPKSVGIEGMPSWQEVVDPDDNWDLFWGTRCGLFDHFHDYTEHDSDIGEGWQRRFWLLAERSAEHVCQDVKRMPDKMIEHTVVVKSPCKLTIKGLADWIGIGVTTIQNACDNSKVKRAEGAGKGREFTPHEVSQIARQRAKSTRFDNAEKIDWEELLSNLGEPPLNEPLKARSKK